MKKYSYFGSLALYFGMITSASALTTVTHDFNDGEIFPYEIRKADQEARVHIVNQSVETHWQQDLYNGTNSGRKAQFMPINDIHFTKHIWMGLKLKVHSDYMAQNSNTHAGLMQIWGFNPTGSANHMAMLKFDGRNGGSLHWQHRYNSVNNFTTHPIDTNFPRDEFVNIIIHVELANYNKGIVQVWQNGVLKVNESNQTIGWGDMDASGMINGTYAAGTSFGQYNYLESPTVDSDGHSWNGHMVGETRTVSYDNVSIYDGENGYDIVNPSTDDDCGDFNAFSTIEAEDYCDMSGVQTESSNDGGSQVGYIQNGDWLKFNDVDFGSGASNFSAQVSSATSGGDIELRLDSSTGKLIGTCAVDGTGSWASYDAVSCSVSGASGVQDLYLVFTGVNGYLFNINSFNFTESTDNCYLPWSDDDFSVEAATVNYSSGAIDISCASSVDISMSLEGLGAMEDADYVNVYYKVDGGAQQVLSENVNAFSAKTVSASGISGNTLEIIANVYNSWSGEIYNLSDISVTSSGQTCATFSSINAEAFNNMSGIVNEGTNIGYIQNGDWAMYRDIDLSCASSLEVMASSQTNGGTIEVRLGSVTGDLIGSVDVSGTGSWATYDTSSVNLESVSGTHDVYLVFTGGNGYLFNIDWLEFSAL